MSRKVRTAEDATRRIIRPGLREALERDGATWQQLYVYLDGATWIVSRWMPFPGSKPPSVEAAFRLEDVPAAARELVVRLLELLEEQAWMARVAKTVADGAVENAVALREVSSDGGAARAHKFENTDLDALIRACKARGEKMRPKEWASQHNLSLRTVNRRIRAIRDE